MPPPSRTQVRRRRVAAVAALAAIVVVAAVLLVVASGGPKRLVPGGGGRSGEYDPLAYSSDHDQDLQRRAAAGFGDVVYEKSPGGVVATARRTAAWRPLVQRAASRTGVDPDTLEAIVFLESAGRPDVVAGGDLRGATGLTQILASTGTSLLHMHVDLARSRALTRRIAAANAGGNVRAARRLARARRAADQRFDPELSLEATGRYLALAKRTFGRDDLAVVSYHMGIGNLQNVLRRYGGDHPSYAKLYFDVAPLRQPSAYALLSSFGDDSQTYYWRILAAEDIMRLSRQDPSALARLAALQARAGAGARRLYPAGIPALTGSGRPAAYKPKIGLRFAAVARNAFAPRPGALSTLLYIGAGARAISGQGPLTVTEAEGVRLQIARRYVSRRQALAFEFVLDRLQAWDLIAWTRGGGYIDIVVGPDAARILPPPAKLAADASR